MNRAAADFEILDEHKKRKHNRPGNIEDRVALEFTAKHAGDFRYVAIWNRWLRYGDDRWQHEDTLKAFDQARKLCREAGDAKAKTVAAVVTLTERFPARRGHVRGGSNGIDDARASEGIEPFGPH
jgi:hypothetical protein